MRDEASRADTDHCTQNVSTPTKSGQNSEKNASNAAKDFGPFLTMGMQLAISVVVFFFIGYWLDRKFGTSPWCTIGGAALGVTGGLIKFLKTATALGKKADRNFKEIEKHTREGE